jgi:isopenicillin N synthase-like dioxygenase
MQVKVCNVRSNDFEADFMESILNTGFAVLTNHGIDDALIKRSQTEWREFFLSDKEYKDSYVNSTDPSMGYYGMKTEKAVGAKKPDLKEFFHCKPKNVVPAETSASTVKMFYLLQDLGLFLLHVLDKNDERKDYRISCDESDNTIIRSLYYPAMDFSQEPDAVRAAAHEDINHITLLVAATASGLQVKDLQGNWHDVPHEENSIVVNVGDMLQLASGGRYKSTTHRVINPDSSRADRISIPIFIHPHSDTILAPGKTAGQYLAERLEQIHGHNKK